MSSVLEISDLTVDFALPGTTVPAVRGVDLTVRRGEVVALVGESGSGKSVTAAAVLGLLPPTARVAGSVRFAGTELIGLSERELNRYRGSGVGMIFQNPATSLDPSFTIGSQLGDTARLHLGLSRPDARELAGSWLDRVGIRDAERVLRSYPHELSGGMRQRVMIALAGLSGPDLLIADEPTTALDATVQKQILDLLLGLADETGTAVLLITHDFGVVSYTSSRVAVMRDGLIVENGSRAEVLGAPSHEYTRTLIEAVPEIGHRHAVPLVHEPGHGRRLLGGTPATGRVHLSERAPEPVVRDGEPILRLAGVTKDFEVGGFGTGRRRSSNRVLEDVSLDVRRGEVLGLIGESGSGKSTLARLSGGLLPVTSGVVTFNGKDVGDPAGRPELRRRFQYVFQDAATALNPRIPVGDQIARPLVRLGRAPDRRSAAVLRDRALDLVGLGAAYSARYPHELSGGQRQRVGIARAVALEPDLLILDEPTSALDVSTQATILNLLLDLKDELDLTYVFIGHNLAVIEFVCDRIGVLQEGRLVETFDAGELFDPARDPATRTLLDAVLPLDRSTVTTAKG